LGPSKALPTGEVYRFGRTAWAAELVSSFLGKNVDIIVMSFYGVAASHIGFYGVVFTLVHYTRLMASRGLSGVLQSAFSSAFHDGGASSLSRWWRLALKFQILVASPGVLLLALLAPEIFVCLLPDYTDATGMLRIFGVLMFGVTLIGGGVHSSALYAMSQQRRVFWLRFSAGGLNLVLDLVLIVLWGAVGALVATGISLLVIGFIELRLTRMNLDLGYPVAFCLKCCFGMAFAGLFSQFVQVTGWVGLVSSSVVFFVVYSVMVFWMKPLEAEDVEKISSVYHRVGPILSRFAG
jgi:O-antigen/teichoic acid export membrane protein